MGWRQRKISSCPLLTAILAKVVFENKKSNGEETKVMFSFSFHARHENDLQNVLFPLRSLTHP